MSRIVLFGATGRVGRRLLTEALDRGHQVGAVVRDRRAVTGLDPRAQVIDGDVTDPHRVADAVSVGGGDSSLWRTAAETVTTELARGTSPRPRIIHLGGGASLSLPDGRRILDQPQFPENYRASAHGQADALAWYASHATGVGVRWTYVSPPPAAGHRTIRGEASSPRIARPAGLMSRPLHGRSRQC